MEGEVEEERVRTERTKDNNGNYSFNFTVGENAQSVHKNMN